MPKEFVPLEKLSARKASELLTAGVPYEIAINTAVSYALQQRAWEMACYQFKLTLKAGSSLAPVAQTSSSVSPPSVPAAKVSKRVRDRIAALSR